MNPEVKGVADSRGVYSGRGAARDTSLTAEVRAKAGPPVHLVCLYGRVNRAVDLTLAIFLLPFAAAVLAFFWILYKIFNAGQPSFIFAGERLGKNKRVFRMYKVRTLSTAATERFSDTIYRSGDGLELTFGKFLRSTRLDETPQLFNIIKGEMSFIGPRPLRPALYRSFNGSASNFDGRFLAPPGLIGYSQVFTPHSTPKRIRACVDSRYMLTRKNHYGDLFILAFTTAALFRIIWREAIFACGNLLKTYRGRGAGADRRQNRRIRVKDVSLFLADSSFRASLGSHPIKIIDIDDRAVKISSGIDLEAGAEINLVFDASFPAFGKKKRARCGGRVHAKSRGQNGSTPQFTYLVFYEACSPLNRYMIDQYVLENSIASFRRFRQLMKHC
jgi:lipopolysaccharide/colanic/teichoic acid biosynthesis glycosyltransferase